MPEALKRFIFTRILPSKIEKDEKDFIINREVYLEKNLISF
jgi:hypothetical protein